ncbi:hypothetical protein E2C01_033105 [Portunus trituberculatus]|uniref:Uncharacterized protein n=1 Tax=Portunus trituberculatus TaxID=210409 RepID=A0A5B7F4R9_PORTR|nr:hypothetical protein [Portunus trituberculatus]
MAGHQEVQEGLSSPSPSYGDGEFVHSGDCSVSGGQDSTRHATGSPLGFSSPFSLASHVVKRVCASSDCRRVLGSAHDDPHSVCIVCSDGFCDVNNRCRECAEWSPRQVLSSRKCQQTLQKRTGSGQEQACMSSTTPPPTDPGIQDLLCTLEPEVHQEIQDCQVSPFSGYFEDRGIDSSEEKADTRVNRETVSPPIFQSMMEYIAQCFPEALGYVEGSHRLVPPGEVRMVEDKRIRFTRAQQMDFSLQAATKTLRCANEGSRPSLARYPSGWYRRIYGVSGHEFAGKVAKLNTDLALTLTTKGKDPQMVVQHADMSRLEDQEEKLLADQLFRSIQFAMVDTAQDSAFALTNVKAMRREAILSQHPLVFLLLLALRR